MTFESRNRYPRDMPTKNQSSWIILGIAIALTVIFHLFYAKFPFGLSFVILMSALLASVFVLRRIAARSGNRWAYVFFPPLAAVTIAQLLYTSPVVVVLGFIVAAISFALFAYWLSSPPVSFLSARSLWPKEFFFETLWPFAGLDEFSGSLSAGKRERNVLTGIALALPFLVLFGVLFAQADALFGKTIVQAFKDVPFSTIFVDGIRDFIVGFIFLGSAWMFFSRLHEERRESTEVHFAPAHETILITFLALINALFLVFVAFQFAYFFGGEAFIRDQGLTYAEYARSGFFQLIAVAGIVFGIGSMLSAFGHLRHRVVRGLSLSLVVLTYVILASAIRRLSLYVDAYGLTVARWWAMAMIVLVAVVLLGQIVAWALSMQHRTYAKMTCLIVLFAFSGLLLVNVEGMVVGYNAHRFLAGQTRKIDVGYMEDLLAASTDAVPQMVTLVNSEWPLYETVGESKTDFRSHLQVDSMGEGVELRKREDWRAFTFSRLWAVEALKELK